MFEHKHREYFALGLRNGKVIIKTAEKIRAGKESEVIRVTPDVEIYKKEEYVAYVE
jgi:hypothetical protein